MTQLQPDLVKKFVLFFDASEVARRLKIKILAGFGLGRRAEMKKKNTKSCALMQADESQALP